MNDCPHEIKKEIILFKGLLHYQECIECKMVREYNPDKKKHVQVMKMWGEWSPGLSH